MKAETLPARHRTRRGAITARIVVDGRCVRLGAAASPTEAAAMEHAAVSALGRRARLVEGDR